MNFDKDMDAIFYLSHGGANNIDTLKYTYII